MANFINGRVTNRMMSNNYLSRMNRNLKNMQKINNQLTTGKEISRPSDNPYKVSRSMQLNTDINTNIQYNENIKDTANWLDTTDTALGQITSVVQRIRTLMVSAGNIAYGSDERTSIADEVNERISELSQILNTNFDGKYIFGGTKVSSKPTDTIKDADGKTILTLVNEVGKEIDMNDPANSNILNILSSDMNTEISQGVKIKYNVTAYELLNFDNTEIKRDADGNVIMGPDGNPETIKITTDAMDLFKEITKNLVSTNEEEAGKINGGNLDDLDKAINNLLRVRSEIGAKQNRMESALTQNEDENFNMTDILSKTEDIDLTEKSIEFAMAQTVYMASLQVSAQILPKSLLDYL